MLAEVRPETQCGGLTFDVKDSMSDTPDKKNPKFLAAGIGVGVAIGCGIGAALGNLAFGIGPGVAIGVLIGALMSKRLH